MNSRPKAYESFALPLSYLGIVVERANITMGGYVCQHGHENIMFVIVEI